MCCCCALQPFLVQGSISLNSGYLQVTDTTPRPSRNIFKRLGIYRDSLRNKSYRDSLIRQITRQNVPEPPDRDSVLTKSERYFTPYTGRVIRDIYYRQVKVFGPRNINDTTFTTSMKLLNLANRLHYNSEEWVIRQSLFFREKDTINAFAMADNERYLRNRPFIQDARLYIINAGASPDSVDLLVVTKDVFEYGADLSQASASAVKAEFHNNNLFGAGQALSIGGSWRNSDNPPWGTRIQYTKYNVMGTFIDVSAGATTLNDFTPAALDTGTFETSYYIDINRPLYRTDASLAGGLFMASNYSMNLRSQPDTLYRDYRYNVIDAWVGYNFIRPAKRGLQETNKPNVAVLLRHYNLYFKDRPWQEKFRIDPIYNNRRYYLVQLAAYRQDFFKAHYFFGFGRTEDIPLGYNVALSSGWESWQGRRRLYTGLEAQKYWVTKQGGLFNTRLGVSSFWQNSSSEDAVIRATVEYYSRLLNFRWGRLRQFVYADYINNPNNFFYKPLEINYEFGIWGYRRTKVNGYQRMNLRSETVYYSPLKVLGFKFNFFSSLELTQITEKSNGLFNNPLHAAIGAGCRIRNENMSLNTLKLSAYYLPGAPAPVNQVFFEITTVVDFRFNISALRKPEFISFK